MIKVSELISLSPSKNHILYSIYFNFPENKSEIKGKEAVLAIPFEEDNIKTANLLIRFFVKTLRYLEMKIIGKILCPGVGARGDILKKEEFLKKAAN